MGVWRTICVAGLLLAGCEPDAIVHYRVQRANLNVTGSESAPTGPERMLGAIIPHGDATWFFKLTGPPEVVAAEKERFDGFIRSIRFDGAAINWDTPAAWHEHPGEGMRYASFHIAQDDHSVELSVTQFPGESGGLLANVNRWRGQLGLGDVTEEDLSELTSQVDVDGVAATLVDFQGTGGGDSRMTPPVAPFAGTSRPDAPGSNERTPPPLRYTLPDGWVEQSAGGGGFRAATIRVRQGADEALLTVIPLGVQSGSLLSNVNRWRDQIGLGPIDETALRDLVKPVDVGEDKADLVALMGSGTAGAGPQGILAAILPHGGQTWYFKMLGPAEIVRSQQPAFEAFLGSVRFGEADGGGAGNG